MYKMKSLHDKNDVLQGKPIAKNSCVAEIRFP